MDEQWFYDEAILAAGAEEKVGTSAYFIPERRIAFKEKSIPGKNSQNIIKW